MNRTLLHPLLPLNPNFTFFRFALIFLIASCAIHAYSQFSSSIELSNLCGPNGFVINGIDPFDGSGESVSSAGDVNGDGIDDLIIGARSASSNGNNLAGESYVVFGTSTEFTSPLNLSTLNGTNGFVINGIDPFDRSGTSVSAAGDVNSDGIDDLIISAVEADPNGNSNAGESYVVFGTSAGFNSPLNLSSLDGSNGFVLNGIDANDRSGDSVSGVGDVNGDGIDDLIIGTDDGDPNGSSSGESYVVFGRSTGFTSPLNLSSLNGINGFVINGIDPIDLSGASVSGAGDVNGDDINDLIIGARAADPNGNISAGESYVVFGTSVGFTSPLNLSTLNGTNGFVINGIDRFDGSGQSVSSAGDVNGDGIDDLIIGANSADPNGNDLAGESYVVFGTLAGFTSPLNLSTLNGTNGFVINGIDRLDGSGLSVSGAGDVNGDAIDDLIIGARSADSNGNNSAGESYVVYGASGGFTSPLNLYTLNGTNGFIINGIDSFDLSGQTVSGAGDVNGDGIDDLIIGAPFADPNGTLEAGESYVVFGSCGPSLLVNGADQFIPNCSNSPQIPDFTLFVGCNRSFQLDNSTGSADLVISSIVSSNPLFNIGLSGFPITIPAGSTLTLPITFTVTGTGVEVSDITIENNDCNDKSYSFSIENENITSCEEQCPQNEVLSGVVYSNIDPEIVIVEDWITAENITVESNADVGYYADQYVELNPQFEVKLGSVFTALIAGCTP